MIGSILVAEGDRSAEEADDDEGLSDKEKAARAAEFLEEDQKWSL